MPDSDQGSVEEEEEEDTGYAIGHGDEAMPRTLPSSKAYSGLIHGTMASGSCDNELGAASAERPAGTSAGFGANNYYFTSRSTTNYNKASLPSTGKPRLTPEETLSALGASGDALQAEFDRRIGRLDERMSKDFESVTQTTRDVRLVNQARDSLRERKGASAVSGLLAEATALHAWRAAELQSGLAISKAKHWNDSERLKAAIASGQTLPTTAAAQQEESEFVASKVREYYGDDETKEGGENSKR